MRETSLDLQRSRKDRWRSIVSNSSPPTASLVARGQCTTCTPVYERVLEEKDVLAKVISLVRDKSLGFMMTSLDSYSTAKVRSAFRIRCQSCLGGKSV